MDYGFEHNGKVFTPNGTTGITPAENDARNEAIQAAEIAEWGMHPRHMLAYYEFSGIKGVGRFDARGSQAKVTTWQGTTLGQITDVSIYRHNFGSRMISLKVKGTNGATYHGRASYDWGQCINLRRSK